MDRDDEQRASTVKDLYQEFQQNLAKLNQERQKFKENVANFKSMVNEAHEEFKAEAAQAEKQIVFDDAYSIVDAKADMLMYDSKFQTSKLTTTYTNTLVSNDKKLDVVKSVLCASV